MQGSVLQHDGHDQQQLSRDAHEHPKYYLWHRVTESAMDNTDNLMQLVDPLITKPYMLNQLPFAVVQTSSG